MSCPTCGLTTCYGCVFDVPSLDDVRECAGCEDADGIAPHACSLRVPSMEPLTLTDAKHATTVREALESALVSGVARPVYVARGSELVASVTLDGCGRWAVFADGRTLGARLTSDLAVAYVVAWAREQQASR